MTREKGRMDMMLYRKIVDEIARVRPTCHLWMTFYGEALLLQYRLFNMIAYAKRQGLTSVILNSNAIMLNEEMIIGLIESGLDDFIVSIDAFSPEVYKEIRCSDHYNAVVENVNNMLRIKSKMRVQKPQIIAQFSIMKENEHQLDAFKAYWLGRGASVKTRPKLSWTGAVEVDRGHPPKRYPCPWLFATCGITWNGKVVQCVVDYDAKYVAGNVNETSLQSIWQGKLKEIRDAQLEGRFDTSPVCANCSDWQSEKPTKIVMERVKSWLNQHHVTQGSKVIRPDM